MCYSALIRSDYRKFVRLFGATMGLGEFAKLFAHRMELGGTKVKIPKAMELFFENPQTAEESEIKALIDAFHAEQSTKFEQELFEQRTRLNDAERKLAVKTTKGALNEQRVATNKISKARLDLADLNRTEQIERDTRFFPSGYAPVMVVQNGQKVVLPMRYLIRRAGMPASEDIKYSGAYNARRDNLQGFWRKQFGYTHGVIAVNKFFENVKVHVREHRELRPGEKEQNVVLEFWPSNGQEMLVACLWSRWTAPGEPDLLSFAAITDEPPEEVAAAGHDRCIVPIRPENVDAWLNPDPKNLKALDDILEDRERPYYEHLLQAA